MTDPRFKTDYGISRLIRYHGKRQNFFDGLHRLTLFVNTVLGSSAFVTIVSGESQIAAWLTAIVAVVSAIDNVVGFAERARKHSEQRTRYYDLYCELIASNPESFVEDVFREKRLRIDRDSPPLRRILDVISRNEEDIARGFERDDTVYVGRLAYFLRHFIDLPPKEWRTVKQVRLKP